MPCTRPHIQLIRLPVRHMSMWSCVVPSPSILPAKSFSCFYFSSSQRFCLSFFHMPAKLPRVYTLHTRTSSAWLLALAKIRAVSPLCCFQMAALPTSWACHCWRSRFNAVWFCCCFCCCALPSVIYHRHCHHQRRHHRERCSSSRHCPPVCLLVSQLLNVWHLYAYAYTHACAHKWVYTDILIYIRYRQIRIMCHSNRRLLALAVTANEPVSRPPSQPGSHPFN